MRFMEEKTCFVCLIQLWMAILKKCWSNALFWLFKTFTMKIQTNLSLSFTENAILVDDCTCDYPATPLVKVIESTIDPFWIRTVNLMKLFVKMNIWLHFAGNNIIIIANEEKGKGRCAKVEEKAVFRWEWIKSIQVNIDQWS